MEMCFKCFTIWVMIVSYFPESLAQTVQCDIHKITTCGMMMSDLTDQTGDTAKTCKVASDIMTCLAPYKEACTSDTSSNGFTMYSQFVASISGFKHLCKCLPLVDCTRMLASDTTTSDGDMSAMCSNYDKTVKCIEPHKETCKDNPSMQQIMQSLSSMERFCKKDGCNITKLQMCIKDMEQLGNLDGLYANVDNICTKVQSYQECSGPLIKKCLKDQEQGYAMAVKQDQMIKQITHLLCVKERQALKQMASCFNKSHVTTEMEKCGKLTTPGRNENGEYEEEVTEAEQCKRMSNFEKCLDMSLKDTCGAEAADVAIRVGQSMLRILYDAKDLECPSDASYRLESGFMTLLLALLISLLF